MVDHNLWGLKLHCDRAFLLDGGRLEIFEDLEEAVAVHTERLLSQPISEPEPEPNSEVASQDDGVPGVVG